MFHNSPLRNSRLGDFAFAWCEKYTVDVGTLTVREKEQSEFGLEFEEFFLALFN
jgi:hypothetical protein